jgi:hypothetical protein
VEQGYWLEGLKATPFFLFNPLTQPSPFGYFLPICALKNGRKLS